MKQSFVWGLVLSVGAVVGCAPRPPNISGAYVARGVGFVELLQLTQSPDGQLLGSMQHFAVQANGAPEQITLSVSGASDGKSVTLVLKRNEPFAVGTNISGSVDGGSLTLDQPNGDERFVSASPEAYQTAVQQLSAKGQALQQQIAQTKAATQQQIAQTRFISSQTQQVTDLTAELNAYSAKIEANHNWVDPMREQQSKILDAARHDLDLENHLKAGNGMQRAQGGQVQARISQLTFQLSSFNMQVDQSVQAGHTHLAGFDSAIGNSPCVSSASLPACADQQTAVQRYRAVRTLVLDESAKLSAAAKQSTADMEALNKQAGN